MFFNYGDNLIDASADSFFVTVFSDTDGSIVGVIFINGSEQRRNFVENRESVRKCDIG